MGRPRIHPIVERTTRECACGCGKTFTPFTIYKNGGIYTPEYMRGHNPISKKTQNVAGWNRGLKKGDHPSLDRMGFQSNHEAFCDWSHVNQKLRDDPELRAKWLASKKGQVAWNRGMTADANPDKIFRGEDHWNWRGNPNGIRETYEYNALRKSVFERDNYTCRECGARCHKGRGSTVCLHMHHVIPVSHDRSKALDPSNVVTLCEACHKETDTFGPKALQKLRCDTSGM